MHSWQAKMFDRGMAAVSIFDMLLVLLLILMLTVVGLSVKIDDLEQQIEVYEEHTTRSQDSAFQLVNYNDPTVYIGQEAKTPRKGNELFIMADSNITEGGNVNSKTVS